MKKVKPSFFTTDKRAKGKKLKVKQMAQLFHVVIMIKHVFLQNEATSRVVPLRYIGSNRMNTILDGGVRWMYC